jgi:hypothetical protein
MTHRVTFQWCTGVLLAACLAVAHGLVAAAGGGASTLGKSEDASAQAARAASAARAATAATPPASRPASAPKGAKTRPRQAASAPPGTQGQETGKRQVEPNR